MADFYFEDYEHRRPPLPLAPNRRVERLWQVLAVTALALGAWYIGWRWTASLNLDALWLAIPLVVAETGAYIGLVLFVANLWRTEDTPLQAAPARVAEILRDPSAADDRPLAVDVFFPTYDEDPELVRLSIADAKKLTYPHPVDLRIHVLDDGRRESMRAVAEEEGVGYITRTDNVGYKAGNMRNAMEQTSGDILVICDADTRPFPTLLQNTLGYFRDPDVAWVQTPQWFYDLPGGQRLPDRLARFGPVARGLGRLVERVAGPVQVGHDPFVNDPKLFYDVIQRRRNPWNASFCCGAGSIHRREAVMEAALKGWAEQIERQVAPVASEIADPELREPLAEAMRREAALEVEFTPYKFHVSEDIYTSTVLHGDVDRDWKSVFHPWVESKMLSPQDLLSWTIQRFKYAGGTLDIALHDSPLAQKGMSAMQKLMYGTTIWSYLGAIWNTVLLVAPLAFLFLNASPVDAYSATFYARLLPFLVVMELAFLVGTWGIRGYQAKSSYIGFFATNLRALGTVFRGETIKFPTTPKDIQRGTYLHLVKPHLWIIGLTLAGIAFASVRYGLGYEIDRAALIANTFWGLNNVFALAGVVRAALHDPDRAAALAREEAAQASADTAAHADATAPLAPEAPAAVPASGDGAALPVADPTLA
ncbi:MAG: cellulose synthase catalytic subunit [Bacteroidota bacterium]